MTKTKKDDKLTDTVALHAAGCFAIGCATFLYAGLVLLAVYVLIACINHGNNVAAAIVAGVLACASVFYQLRVRKMQKVLNAKIAEVSK